MDLGTGLALLGSKDLIVKILGPTADYLGGELKSYTEKGANNLKLIFEKTAEKLGSKIDEPGEVPPRVLKGILQEGYFCEDDLMAEYFAGILASSRTDFKDDRGVYFNSLISKMSSYQIKTHYLFYYAFKDCFDGVNIDLFNQRKRTKIKIYLPLDIIFNFIKPKNIDEFENMLNHCIYGLIKEDLLSNDFCLGSIDTIRDIFKINIAKPGLIFTPSIIGIDLFLSAYGVKNINVGNFLCVDNKFKIFPSVNFDLSLEKLVENINVE